MCLGLLTFGLSLRVQRVDVHREVEVVLDRLDVVAMELVRLVDALCVPVCPVQLILKNGDCKRVRQACQRRRGMMG